MRQGEWGDLEVAQSELARDKMRFGDEVTPWPRPVVKSVREHAAKVVHRWLVRIDGQRLATSQIAKPAAIVQAHDVVGMRMGEDNRIQPANVLPQHLEPKLRGGVHDEARLRAFDVDGRAGAMVFQVGQEFGRVFLAYDGHALGRARAEKNETES